MACSFIGHALWADWRREDVDYLVQIFFEAMVIFVAMVLQVSSRACTCVYCTDHIVV